MAITKKQKTAIAAIILVGALATGAALFTNIGGSSGGHDDEHAHEKEHAREKEHAHDEKEHAHDEKHDDKAQHGKEEKGHKDHGERKEVAETPGKIALTAEQVAKAGIVVTAAGPAQVSSGVEFPGEIRFNEDRTAHVVPRLAGVVESVPANIGQQVKKGQVLAVLASTTLSDQRSELLAAQRRLELARTTHDREKKLWEGKISAEQDYLVARNALQEAQIAVQNAQQKLTAVGASTSSSALNRYELRAPFDGMIVEKHISLGEAVADNTNVFTLSDLSAVWAEFVVSAQDLDRVRLGAKVEVRSTAFDGKAEGTVSYVGSLLGEQTRTAKARVTLTNPQMAWRPGLFVTVRVIGAAVDVPVAVPADAIQEVEGKTVVFLSAPDGFTMRPVKVGRTNGKIVEIVEGLDAGARIAAANSFVLKAELGKSSAEHSH